MRLHSRLSTEADTVPWKKTPARAAAHYSIGVSLESVWMSTRKAAPLRSKGQHRETNGVSTGCRSVRHQFCGVASQRKSCSDGGSSRDTASSGNAGGGEPERVP
jgi:hypothetical protein